MVQPVLVYDGDCAFCDTCVDVARRRLVPGLAAVPWQRADLSVANRERARHEVLLLHPDGRRVWGGIDAVAVLLLTGPRRVLRPAGAALRLRPLRALGAVAYRWVARNRHRMPGSAPTCGLGPSM